MSKLQDLTQKTTPADTDQVYLFDAAGTPKDLRATVAALRATAKVETLTNKTLNTPTTAKPAYVETLQVPGAKITNLVRGSGNLTPGVMAGGSELTVTLAVPDLLATDAVMVNPVGVLETGLVMSYWWVSAADTLSVRLRNASGSATTGTPIAVNVLAFRHGVADT